MINAIFAADQFGGMGLQGSLPWPHNARDLQNFKNLTQGHIVVMGRRTYDDPLMPKPLADRVVYVASNRAIAGQVNQICGNIPEKILQLERLNPDKIVWVIGGSDVLAQCEDIYDRIYLTHIKRAYRADTKINLKSLLSGRLMRSATADSESDCTLVVYESIFRRQK